MACRAVNQVSSPAFLALFFPFKNFTMRQLRMADFTNPHLKSEAGYSEVTVPQRTLEQRLVMTLHRLFHDQEPTLATSLTKAQFDCLRSLYLPSVPEPSSTWAVRAQHISDGRTALYKALNPAGLHRTDFKRVLENVRYVDFLSSIDAWIDGQTNTAPRPLRFDARSRACAKEVLSSVLEHLRIPANVLEVGTLTPLYLQKFGYAVRTTLNNTSVTFLLATPNGERLTAPISGRATLQGLMSSNRQLSNLLERKSPVILERALAPRPVLDHGIARVALFCPTGNEGPYKYLHLPPSITERHLVPVVDIESLQAGAKIVHLYGKLSRDRIATVDVTPRPGSHNEPIIQILLPASPIKQGAPFVDFVASTASSCPPPLTVEINRRAVSEKYTHLRVLLAGQMSAPAHYPLRRITVHALTSPSGVRFLGLYPPGVSPIATPPLKTFVRDVARGGWTPIEADGLWQPDQKFLDDVKELARKVANGTQSVSRDAWYSLHRLSATEPLKFQALVLSDMNPHSLQLSPELADLRALPGWTPFVARVEDQVRVLQAQSVPYIARLLSLISADHDLTLEQTVDRLPEYAFSFPTNPLAKITRLAVVAPDALQQTIDELRESPHERLAKLASGKKKATEFVASLSSTASYISAKPPHSVSFDDNFSE